MTIETELKLRLPPNRNAVFRRLMAARVPEVAPETEQLVSVYYDTPTLALAQQDMGLRLRRVGDQWLQTLKLDEQAGAGLHQRPELEVVVSGDSLELEQIPDRKIRQFLAQESIATGLAPLFTTDITRTRWLLRNASGNTLEVCLDHGTISSQQRTLKINEVEIELKQGEVRDVFELALELAASLPLIPDPHSKAEQGYRLYLGSPPQEPAKAHLPVLRNDMTRHQAFQMIVQETLRHLQANVPGILDNDDMECVHQARVALRRLRSAQKAFASIATNEEWGLIMTEVQWLATLLGQVRDLDVFLTETLPGIEATLAPDADFTPLKTAMDEQRHRCRGEAQAALTSARFGALQLRLLAWLNLPAPSQRKGKAARLRDFARRSLNQRWRQVNRLARNWQALDQEQRHDLRKRAKKLRYTAEFFSPLYKPKRVARYLKRLQALQEILGEMNDSVAAQALLAQFVSSNAELGRASGLVAGWLAHGAQQSETRLARTLKRLGNTVVFW